MSLPYGRSVTWGSEPRINSSELIEVNYLFFRIACHNIFPISHIHTIPLDRCAFLYAFITYGSMRFPFLFIETIAEVYRSKFKAHNLFCPVFIYMVLLFLGLDSFPSLKLVHIIALIEATFLKKRQAQMKSAKPSTETLKGPRGEASTATPASGDQPTTEEILVDPIATMDLAADDTADPTVAPPLSLRAVMETFTTT